jgi:uncharacterized protein (DUF927 family)
MDNIKLELWEGKIPEIINLNKNSIVALKEKLCNSFSKKNDIICNKFYENIYIFEKVVGHIDNIDLFKIFQNCDNSLTIDDFIYLDWGNLEEIVQVNLNDFIVNIDNFWYPSSDDLSIFNQNCNWILNIHHYGAIGCVQPKKQGLG